MPLIPGHEPLGDHRAHRRPRRQALGRQRRRSRRRRGADPLRLLPRLPERQLSASVRGRGALFRHGYVPHRASARAVGRLRRLHVSRSAARSCTAVRRATSRASIAVMFNPLGAGFRWAVEIPHTEPGDTRADPRPRPARPGERDRGARRRRRRDHRHRPHARRRASSALRARRSAPTTSSTSSRRTCARACTTSTGGRGADVVVEVSANAHRAGRRGAALRRAGRHASSSPA